MSSMEKILGRNRAGGEGEGSHWLSVSDLMAGLMMVFLFIAVSLMRQAVIVTDVAVAIQQNHVNIFNALTSEFSKDLQQWNATIDKETLAFEFRAPDVLFGTGQTEVRPRFQAILNDFFPRYLRTLGGFKDSISEIRIEGHTSSEWNGKVSGTETYFHNMSLSQGRTNSVLRYVYELPAISAEQDWVRKHFAAVGFSSSRLIKNDDGSEDAEQSRRVSFRVITNAETQILKILKAK